MRSSGVVDRPPLGKGGEKPGLQPTRAMLLVLVLVLGAAALGLHG